MIAIIYCHQNTYYQLLIIKFNPIQDGGVSKPDNIDLALLKFIERLFTNHERAITFYTVISSFRGM